MYSQTVKKMNWRHKQWFMLHMWFLCFPGLPVLFLQSWQSVHMVQDEGRQSVWSRVKGLGLRNFVQECVSTTEQLNYGNGFLPRLGREDHDLIEASMPSKSLQPNRPHAQQSPREILNHSLCAVKWAVSITQWARDDENISPHLEASTIDCIQCLSLKPLKRWPLVLYPFWKVV